MEMLNLLIADSSEEFIQALTEELHGSYHIFSCTNGKEALNCLYLHKPEVLVLDLMLPELDGVTLLNELAEHGILPMVLAISQYISDYMTESAADLGISYIMRKPCDPRATALRIRDLSRKLKPKSPSVENPQAFVTEILLTLNIPSRLRGFSQLRDAILMLAQNPDIPITKELYPAIGSSCQSTWEQVERTMRSAVCQGWDQRNPEVWAHYFPPNHGRPSNGVFLSRLAEELRMKSGR